MRIMLSVILLFAAVDLRSSWESLVEAEKSFARTSIAEGTRPAFLSVLADDSIIFRPRAVPGKKWMEENAGVPGQLSWAPEFADIASAGDLGYTTGPWEFRRNPQDNPAAFGHYVTLWRKQASGVWKVELDTGIGHDAVPKPDTVNSPQLAKQIGVAKPAKEVEKARSAVIRADQTASSSPAKYLADSIRFYRDGRLPLLGKTAAQNWLSQNPGSLAIHQAAVRISNSADLAYSYGTAEFAMQDKAKPAVTMNYLRIWKVQPDGSWKITLDVLTQIPG